MKDPEVYLNLADQLEAYGCTQLPNGLRQGIGIGEQIQSLGSLNGYHPGNPYVQAIDAISDIDLAEAGFYDVCRMVDAAFATADVNIDQSEKDILAQVLWENII